MDKDKIDKKDHILDVAERVFSELGFDGASTRTISGEAGVNMAMLNYYFGSKEGLFLAVFQRKIEPLHAEFDVRHRAVENAQRFGQQLLSGLVAFENHDGCRAQMNSY